MVKPTMPHLPHFEYRVVKLLIDNKYPCYQIAEVFYDEDKAINYTLVNSMKSFPNPNFNVSDEKAINGLKEDINDMLTAFNKPFIDAETLNEIK